MQLNDLNLNLLIYLNALLDEKSISKAAKRVFLSQSAMSNALARMRDFFQDELLVQVGRVMVLTPFAEGLVHPIRDVLGQIQAISSSRPNFEPAKSKRKIIIMTSDYIMDVLVQRVIPRVSREAPGMQLEFPVLTSAYPELFDRGQLDLIIVPERYISKENPSEPLFRDTFTCAVWSKNRLVGNHISFEQYKQLGHAGVNLGDWHVTTYEDWFIQRYGHVRRMEVIVPSFRSALQAVMGTDRIVTCHWLHAKMYARQYSLRLIKPPVEIPPVIERIQWHKYVDCDPALIWLRGLFQSAAAQMLPTNVDRI